MASDVQFGRSGDGTADDPMMRDEELAKREIKEEQDRLAFGKSTTDLEWDGIRKLDYPPPRWWVLTFWGCFLFAVLWWILYPSWPFFNSYFPGILGYDQRDDVRLQIAGAAEAQSQWREQIDAADTATIMTDPDLLTFALVGGEARFKDSCAPCHGLGGAGQLSYPSLADDEWLWGGSLEAIEHTIRHGVRNGVDPDARDSLMPAFGDGILTHEEIEAVAQHVLSFSDRATDPEAVEAGAQLYLDNCAACHGEAGEGMEDLGAPTLNDAIWLYGGELHEIAAQIARPRMGVMPSWQDHLSDSELKMLTVYVHSLGGGQ